MQRLAPLFLVVALLGVFVGGCTPTEQSVSVEELLTAENMIGRLCNEKGFCGALMYVRSTSDAHAITQAYIDVAFDGNSELFRAFTENLERVVGVTTCQPDESAEDCRERTESMCFPESRDGDLYFPDEQDGSTCHSVAAFVPATVGTADMPTGLGQYDPIVMVMVGESEFRSAFSE